MPPETQPASQQAFLREVKEALGLTWDELAQTCGINARALKTYRMPEHSKDHRTLPALARQALARQLQNVARKVKA